MDLPANQEAGEDSDAEALSARALARGYADPAALEAARTAYRAGGAQGGFGAFLVARGVLSAEQLADLASTDTLGATLVEDPTTPLGRVVSGCRIERKLGEGGMGSVYLASRGDDEVVVKFLAPEQARDPTWRARFLREAEVMRRIAHPNIVAIHDVEGEGDSPHIVMEFVDGEALDETLRRGPLDPLEAARIARDVAAALAHAHAAGIVHRDIKPANILRARDGSVKVLDFGLAKSVEADDGLSLPGQVLGTPYYMAPEQWGDHAVDARCDVFSLGATLFHLVTGRVPFPGKSPAAISRKVLAGEVPAPRALAPEIPEDLELVIYRMLDRDRNYRYASADECRGDLERVLAGVPIDDVPRLEALTGPDSGRRHPLLPGDGFLVGRDEACQVALADRSVSRQHARIERGPTGYVLRDLGSTYGTFVGPMRVREVVLKDGDEVRFGRVELRFRDGGLGRAVLSTRRLAPDRLRVRSLPLPLVRALILDGDRRVVVPLLEGLAPEAVEDRVAEARSFLRARLGGEVAEEAGRRMESALRKLRRRIPAQLFSITHENLGDDLDRWLVWWDSARPRYPSQLAPSHPHAPARLEVVEGEGAPRSFPLEEQHTVYEIGREHGRRIQLDSRSVSRLHATVLRFHKRYAVRDEGSRFGTLLDGRPVRYAFLRSGCRLTLGKVTLEFREDRPDPSATQAGEALQEVDPHAFDALVALRHPACAAGLLRFLEAVAGGLSWVGEEAERLFPKDRERRQAFAVAVNELFAREAARARELLPALLGADAGGDVAAWQRLLHERLDDLGPQLLPRGWFPLGTG
ncbi:MAG: FHA domain-containing protein [Planctomycetota bacterium]|nr:MAG: FHA domain-containing protein [Planctomycetota bacterium]